MAKNPLARLSSRLNDPSSSTNVVRRRSESKSPKTKKLATSS